MPLIFTLGKDLRILIIESCNTWKNLSYLVLLATFVSGEDAGLCVGLFFLEVWEVRLFKRCLVLRLCFFYLEGVPLLHIELLVTSLTLGIDGLLWTIVFLYLR